jgi:hypothetical protein
MANLSGKRLRVAIALPSATKFYSGMWSAQPQNVAAGTCSHPEACRSRKQAAHRMSSLQLAKKVRQIKTLSWTSELFCMGLGYNRQFCPKFPFHF